MNTLTVIRSSGGFAGIFFRKGVFFSILVGAASTEAQLVTALNQTYSTAALLESSSPAFLFDFSSTFTCPNLAFFSPSQAIESIDESVSTDFSLQNHFDVKTGDSASPEGNSNPPGNGAQDSLPSFFSAHSFSGAEMAAATQTAVVEIRPPFALFLTLR